jgi:hypothetical protein
MRRREFIAGLGSAAAWPVVARAQQGDRVRRIGVLLSSTADDPVFQTWVGAFLRGWRNRAGSSATTCRSTRAGRDSKPMTFVGTRRNWWRSCQTSGQFRLLL